MAFGDLLRTVEEQAREVQESIPDPYEGRQKREQELLEAERSAYRSERKKQARRRGRKRARKERDRREELLDEDELDGSLPLF